MVLARASAAALAAAAVALGAGCGGGGELTPVEYEAQLGDVELASALASGDADALREAADDLDDLAPPDGAEDAHDDLVEGLRDVADEREDDEGEGDEGGDDDGLGSDDEELDGDDGDDLDGGNGEAEDGDAEERVERALAELGERGYDVGATGAEDDEGEEEEEDDDD